MQGKAERDGQTCSNALDGDRLWTLVGGRQRLLGRVKRRVEEGVNEGRLAKAGFALEGGVSTQRARRRAGNGPTTMAVNWKPLRTLFLWTWFGRFAKPT